MVVVSKMYIMCKFLYFSRFRFFVRRLHKYCNGQCAACISQIERCMSQHSFVEDIALLACCMVNVTQCECLTMLISIFPCVFVLGWYFVYSFLIIAIWWHLTMQICIWYVLVYGRLQILHVVVTLFSYINVH